MANLSHKSSQNSNHFSPYPFLIGVTGGTASGKTTVCQKIINEIGKSAVSSIQRKVAIISQDSFYRELNPEEQVLAASDRYNFDHPDSFDKELLKSILQNIALGKTVNIPIYDFKTHKCTKERIAISKVDVILFEGILVLYEPFIRDLLHLKIFVDVDSDVRLSRRILRDIQQRGRNLDSILKQYTKFVKPSFEEFVLPTKQYADVIIPRGVENIVAIDLIAQHISNILSANNPILPNIAKHRLRRFSESDSFVNNSANLF